MMSFSEMSKKEAVQLIEAKIKGEQYCYSSIVNEAVRMIKEERNKVELYEKALKEIAKYEDNPDVRRFALFAQRTLNQ